MVVSSQRDHDRLAKNVSIAERTELRDQEKLRKAYTFIQIAVSLVMTFVLSWSLSWHSWQSQGMEAIDAAGIITMGLSLFAIVHFSFPVRPILYSPVRAIADLSGETKDANDAMRKIVEDMAAVEKRAFASELKLLVRFLVIGLPLSFVVVLSSVGPDRRMDPHSIWLGVAFLVFPAVAASLLLDYREKKRPHQAD